MWPMRSPLESKHPLVAPHWGTAPMQRSAQAASPQAYPARGLKPQSATLWHQQQHSEGGAVSHQGGRTLSFELNSHPEQPRRHYVHTHSPPPLLGRRTRHGWPSCAAAPPPLSDRPDPCNGSSCFQQFAASCLLLWNSVVHHCKSWLRAGRLCTAHAAGRPAYTPPSTKRSAALRRIGTAKSASKVAPVHPLGAAPQHKSLPRGPGRVLLQGSREHVTPGRPATPGEELPSH